MRGLPRQHAPLMRYSCKEAPQSNPWISQLKSASTCERVQEHPEGASEYAVCTDLKGRSMPKPLQKGPFDPCSRVWPGSDKKAPGAKQQLHALVPFDGLEMLFKTYQYLLPISIYTLYKYSSMHCLGTRLSQSNCLILYSSGSVRFR